MTALLIAGLLNFSLAQETDNTDSVPESSDPKSEDSDVGQTAAVNDETSTNETVTPEPQINPVTKDIIAAPSGSVEGKVVTQKDILLERAPVLHFGPDIYQSANLAVSYTAAATDLSPEVLEAVDPTKLMNLPLSLGEQGTIEECSGTTMSSARLKQLSQKLDMALAYYELDKAQEYFNTAEQGLLCLNTILDTDIVARLYYLKGLLDYNNGDESKTLEAYENAIRFKPNLNWDPVFPPDSQPLFEQAKSDFSSRQGVPVNVYPESAKALLWINGMPATDSASLTLNKGDNFLQYEGIEMKNARVVLSEDDTEVTLVVPPAINKDIISWVDNEDNASELEVILETLYPNGQTIYAVKEGLVYRLTLSENTDTWTELEVPTFAQVFGVNTKQTIGKGLYWTGIALTTAGGLYSANQYTQAYRAVDVATAASTGWEVYNEQSTTYAETEDRYQSGVIITGIGTGLMSLGYLLQK